MRKYEVTVLVPQTTTIEAMSDQDAHNEVTRMMHYTRVQEGQPAPVLHSIVCLEEDGEYPPSPAAS